MKKVNISKYYLITIAPLGTKYYPIQFLTLPKRPLVVFLSCKNLSSWADFCQDEQLIQSISVVGSRNSCFRRTQYTVALCSKLSSEGYTIVSGLAYGIDAAAHEGALKGGGVIPTVAVLGNGLPSVYPKAHENLARRIVESGGCVLSAFPPNFAPLPRNFLIRNVLIATLCSKLVVMQATQRSGALSTARHAIELGKEVYAVPGPIEDTRFLGSNNLLKESAYVLTEEKDILGFNSIEKKLPLYAKGSIENKLFKILNELGVITLQDLQGDEELILALTKLEIEGLVTRSVSGEYTRVASVS
jgi:DNA processing protein